MTTWSSCWPLLMPAVARWPPDVGRMRVASRYAECLGVPLTVLLSDAWAVPKRMSPTLSGGRGSPVPHRCRDIKGEAFG
jgi:hypothetical protein